jgi:hypothetical protein
MTEEQLAAVRRLLAEYHRKLAKEAFLDVAACGRGRTNTQTHRGLYESGRMAMPTNKTRALLTTVIAAQRQALLRSETATRRTLPYQRRI